MQLAFENFFLCDDYMTVCILSIINTYFKEKALNISIISSLYAHPNYYDQSKFKRSSNCM